MPRDVERGSFNTPSGLLDGKLLSTSLIGRESRKKDVRVSYEAETHTTHHGRGDPAPLAVADGRMRGQDSLGEQELHGLAAVPDRALPVLGGLAAADVLELVGGQPGVLGSNGNGNRGGDWGWTWGQTRTGRGTTQRPGSRPGGTRLQAFSAHSLQMSLCQSKHCRGFSEHFATYRVEQILPNSLFKGSVAQHLE